MPLNIYLAFRLLQKSTVRPAYSSTCTCLWAANVCFSHSFLFSSGNIYDLLELLPMATIILSNKGSALNTIDSCPLVTGSKEPGKTAMRGIRISLAGYIPTNIRIVTRNSLSLALYHFACNNLFSSFNNIRCIKAIFAHQLIRCTAFSEAVFYSNHFHHARIFAC